MTSLLLALPLLIQLPFRLLLALPLLIQLPFRLLLALPLLIQLRFRLLLALPLLIQLRFRKGPRAASLRCTGLQGVKQDFNFPPRS